MDYKKLAEEIANGIEAETMKLIDTEFKNLSPEDKQRYQETRKAEHEAWALYLEVRLKELCNVCQRVELIKHATNKRDIVALISALGEAEKKIKSLTEERDEAERKLTEAQATIEKMRSAITETLEEGMCGRSEIALRNAIGREE